MVPEKEKENRIGNDLLLRQLTLALVKIMLLDNRFFWPIKLRKREATTTLLLLQMLTKAGHFSTHMMINLSGTYYYVCLYMTLTPV